MARAGLASGVMLANLLSFGVIALWWLMAQWVPPYLLPGPFEVAQSFWSLVTTWQSARHVLITVGHVVAALGLTVLSALVLALLSQLHPALNVLINRRLQPFLNSFSGYGWVLLFMIWIGINSRTVVASITVVLLPLALLNIVNGLKSIDRELIEMIDSVKRGPLPRLLHVVIPTVRPYFAAALLGCFGLSWKIVLTAELFGGTGGIGYLVNRARQDFDTSLIFACIVVAIIMVRLGELCIAWLSRAGRAGV